jgi:hypothetical protein
MSLPAPPSLNLHADAGARHSGDADDNVAQAPRLPGTAEREGP